MSKLIVLVTGGSSGIGHATVNALAPHAERLYAASRSQPLLQQENVSWLRMDVRDPGAVRSGVETVLQQSGRIDVLVCNAGVMVGGLIEETDLQVAHRLFDTNFWGVAEVTAQVLPAMRRQRSGQVVIVGSLAGRLGTPGQGFYAASKFALAGYAETLAAEICGFGIRVNLVEPGFHATQLHGHMLSGGVRVGDYDPVREQLERTTRSNIAGGDDPGNVARAIEHLVLRQSLSLRHPVGRDARWVPRIKALVPERMFRTVLRRKFGLVPKL